MSVRIRAENKCFLNTNTGNSSHSYGHSLQMSLSVPAAEDEGGALRSVFVLSTMSRVAKRFYRVDSLYSLENLDRGESAQEENRWVFEVSHEAANKGKTTTRNYQWKVVSGDAR